MDQAIIRGVPASAPAFDAIGSIGVLDDDGAFRPVCTGTLIAPDRVLTAKHCTMRSNGAPLLDGGSVYFALGPDATSPLRLLAILSAKSAEPAHGGVTQLGSDLAIYVLQDPTLDVRPFTVSLAPVDSIAVGTELTAFGYGADAEACGHVVPSRPIRRSGGERLGATRGNVFDHIFGDYTTYLEHTLRTRSRTYADERYINGGLLEGYELWAATGPDLAQTCYGDSGGPVMIERNGAWQIVGVTSWSWSSELRRCDYGAVVAVPGPASEAIFHN